MTKEERAAEVERIKLDSWLNEQTALYAAAQKKAVEIAMNLLSAHSPLDFISQMTGLPLADIQKLQQGLPI
jgi:hypothetical protein